MAGKTEDFHAKRAIAHVALGYAAAGAIILATLAATATLASAQTLGETLPRHDITEECERQAAATSIIRDAVDLPKIPAIIPYAECRAREEAALSSVSKIWDHLSSSGKRYCSGNTTNYYALKMCAEVQP